MTQSSSDPSGPSASYTAARLQLQRVSTHILARARFAADGRFGLRVTFSGIATPAFGDDGEVVRIAGDSLIRERRSAEGARSAVMEIPGHSLAELAAFAGVNIDEAFSAGTDTPEVGDPDAPIELGDEGSAVLSWLAVGAAALDRMLPKATEPSVIQLWPEHFDVAFDAETAHGRANFGASPGDGGELRPYLYVGPWGSDRPGDPGYWNASFGATLPGPDLGPGQDPVTAAARFYQQGMEHLA